MAVERNSKNKIVFGDCSNMSELEEQCSPSCDFPLLQRSIRLSEPVSEL